MGASLKVQKLGGQSCITLTDYGSAIGEGSCHGESRSDGKEIFTKESLHD